jgi:hypothetical protein
MEFYESIADVETSLETKNKPLREPHRREPTSAQADTEIIDVETAPASSIGGAENNDAALTMTVKTPPTEPEAPQTDFYSDWLNFLRQYPEIVSDRDFNPQIRAHRELSHIAEVLKSAKVTIQGELRGLAAARTDKSKLGSKPKVFYGKDWEAKSKAINDDIWQAKQNLESLGLTAKTAPEALKKMSTLQKECEIAISAAKSHSEHPGLFENLTAKKKKAAEIKLSKPQRRHKDQERGR